MNYRLKVLTEFDHNVGERPTYWYSLECQGDSGKWVMLRVAHALLDIYRIVKRYGLDWDKLRVVNIIRVY